jgi:hypothetical protein
MIWHSNGYPSNHVNVGMMVNVGEHENRMRLPVKEIKRNVYTYEEMIAMTYDTTMQIAKYSTDEKHSNALEALMDYWHVTNLANISEEMGLEFLGKLQRGEIRIYNEIATED